MAKCKKQCYFRHWYLEKLSLTLKAFKYFEKHRSSQLIIAPLMRHYFVTDYVLCSKKQSICVTSSKFRTTWITSFYIWQIWRNHVIFVTEILKSCHWLWKLSNIFEKYRRSQLIMTPSMRVYTSTQKIWNSESDNTYFVMNKHTRYDHL